MFGGEDLAQAVSGDLSVKDHFAVELDNGDHRVITLPRGRVGLDVSLFEEKGDLLLDVEENPFRLIAERAVGLGVEDQLRC